MLKRLMLLLALISRSVQRYALAFVPDLASRLAAPFVVLAHALPVGGKSVMLTSFRLAAGYLYCPRLLPHEARGTVQFSLVKPCNTYQL